MVNYKDFAKSVTIIYNSQLSNQYKYDQTAFLLAELLKASVVSILLYESKEDALVCKGSHVSPQYAKLKAENPDITEVLENISVYDFLNNKNNALYNEVDEDLYSEYNRNSLFPNKVDINAFFQIKSRYSKNIDLYRFIRKVLTSEQYLIDDKTITGNYFHKLLNYESYNNKFEIKNLMTAAPSEKRCFNVLRENLNIEIDENGFYIALPLYATERYFGVIRIIYPKKQGFMMTDRDGNYYLNDPFAERLGYFSQLISLHIETNYYLESYKKLSLINETIVPKSIGNLRKTCDVIGEVLNCNGVLIRLFDEKSSTSEINGYTKSLNEYVKFVKYFKDPEVPGIERFSTSIVELFEDGPSIVAVNFNVENNVQQNIKIFALDEKNNVINYEKSLKIADLQSIKFTNQLANFKISQLTIAPIPNITKGYLVFSNTKNRAFIRADIEIIILAAKGVGLEINHIHDRVTIKEQEKEIVQTEAMANLVHQFAAPLHGMFLHADNIVNDRVPKHLVKDRMLTVYHNIKNSIGQIKRFQRILALDGIQPKKSKTINVRQYLINRSRVFQSIASGKGIKIYVYSDNDINDVIQIDDELFDEVINNLIENAVKYSFYRSQLVEKAIKYDDLESTSCGNILIHFACDSEKTVIRVTNWGAIINSNEKEKVFDRHYRGNDANNFSTIGSGIGLFLVRKILKILNSRIELETDLYRTTFKITLKNR